MRLILHIGRHKSATSYIQSWMYENHSELLDLGILYPKSILDEFKLHYGFAKTLDTNINGGHNSSEMDDYVAKIKQEVFIHNPDTLIISSEYFQEFDCLDLLKNFINALNFEEIIAICYIREHLDYAISSYRQAVQTGSLLKLDQIINFYSEAHFRFFVALWQDHTNLILRPFSKNIWKNNCIINDFCASLNIPFDKKFKHTSKRNPSIGGNLLASKVIANSINVQFDYSQLELACLTDSEYTRCFCIDKEAEINIRSTSGWNKVLLREYEDFEVLSFSNFENLICKQRLLTDLEYIQDTFKLSDITVSIILSCLLSPDRRIFGELINIK